MFTELIFTKIIIKVGAFMFIGRKKELNIISNFLNKKNSALMIYGLRRVGKSSLIKKALIDNKCNYVYYECIKADEEVNVNLFVELLVEQLNFVEAKFDNFLQVFKELDKNYKNLVIVIDEFSYLKQYYIESKKSSDKALKIDSEFQIIIDQFITNHNLILSGSSIHIMNNLLDHASPLYGRFDFIIKLKEMTYIEAQEMLPNLSHNELIAFYSVFGGSPFVLSRINEDKTIKENICDLLLDEFGSLRNHISMNCINELESDNDLNIVLSSIKNGSKKYNEIDDQCNIKTTGLLDKKLKKLIDLDIIECTYPIGRENDRRKKYYQIKNNLLKFYYAYIFNNINKIYLLGKDRFYDLYIEKSIKSFISKRFENIVRSYFTLAIEKGMYNDVIDIGTYFTDNSEFDCVLKKIDNTFAIFEVKYYKNPVDNKTIYKEIEQINYIKEIKISEIGFVSSSGFDDDKNKNITYLSLKELFFE